MIPSVELKTRDPEPIADTTAMFERLARDPNTSVEKIERLMALWERNEAKKAETIFNAALSETQAQMVRVRADAENPQTRSKYASYAAIDKALRPIYTTNGFGLTFNTGDSPIESHVRVLCDVVHCSGYSKTYHIDMPADGKGAKGGDVMTKTHATGSAVSYGMRYLLKMIFNVAVGEDDDDGNRAGGLQAPQKPPRVDEPKGFTEWFDSLTAAADNGMASFREAWNGDNRKEFRTHAVKCHAATCARLRAKAEAIR